MEARDGEAVDRAVIQLPHDVEAGDAFRLIALSCLRHLTLNEPALAAGHAEGVHQMRVATRRLRAAIALFHELFDDRETERIKAELRWLTEQLGPVRDYDVLVERSVRATEDATSDTAAFTRLTTTLREVRSQKLAQAQTALRSERYHELVLHTTRWILGGEWTRDPGRRARRFRHRRLLPLSRELLQRRRKRIAEQLRALAKLTPERRHELRIAVKKLHYGAQFFSSLFPAHLRRRKKLLHLLKRLQARLGQLNDARVQQSLTRDLLHADSSQSAPELSADAAFALGLLEASQRAEQSRLVKRARREGRKLDGLPPFWQQSSK
jgi:CHAD domain-containing protein